ncbi:MAG: GAF domain-containing protein [Myxococcales bacterium]|nr:GAF domain-containing protein [Myxococcales bacterium]
MSDAPRSRLARWAQAEDPAELRGALREAVAELQAYSVRITRVNEVTHAVGQSLTIAGILTVLWQQARWILDFDVFNVCLRGEGGWLRIALGGRGRIDGVPLADHPLRLEIERGQPGLHPAVVLPGEVAPVASVLTVPLVSENEVIGGLLFGSRRPDAYGGDDLRIASMLGLQLASVIRNADRFDELNVLAARLDETNQRRRELLYNMLPREVADELLRAGRVEPVFFESATVMFVDFVGFTRAAAEIAPKHLLTRLDTLFRGFDAIIARHGLEKLKTIGDAYMCVGGVPVPRAQHAADAVAAAVAILAYLDQIAAHEEVWPVRIGVHSGPLIAGVIGTHKYAYDVWGDTVNVAARLEAASEPGCINISHETWLQVRDSFHCVARGAQPVRGRGMVPMYFVEGARDAGQSREARHRRTLPLPPTPRRPTSAPLPLPPLDVLFIGPEGEIAQAVQAALLHTCISLRAASGLGAVPARLAEADAQVVLLDLRLEGALEAVVRTRSLLDPRPVVVIVGPTDEGLALSALRRGAADVVRAEPTDWTRLARTLRQAAARATFEPRRWSPLSP